MYWDLIPVRVLPSGDEKMTRMNKKFASEKEARIYAHARGITRYRVEKMKDSGDGSDLNVHKMVNETISKSRHLAKQEGRVIKETKPHVVHKGSMVLPAHIVKHIVKLSQK